MLKQFTCPKGHRWQVPVDGNLPVAVQCISCPDCGSPAETFSPDALGEAAANPETAQAGLSETVVPRTASPVSCSCPGCGKVFKVKAILAGKKARCPHCQQSFVIPPGPGGHSPVLTANLPTLPPHLAGAGVPLSPETLARAQVARTQERCELYDFLAPPQQADELGRLGPYRVLTVLGAGGMGVVFQAEDPMLKRKVALKVMLPALAASVSARQRFLREAQTAAAIEHDHIVAIFQVAEDRGVPFIAMPFLKGESLEDRLQRQPVPPITEALRIAREIAQGLAAAHAQGLIHRDIKPANIWLEARSCPFSARADALVLARWRTCC
ncbi:MAG: hypothetical protein FJ271_27310 [Planctomycetes bacterium]|nr:hypothetical protein [Planctomycetota bacterium]